MTSHVIAYRSLELLFGTHTFHFNCFFDDFNCVFTQIRCLSRVLISSLLCFNVNWNVFLTNIRHVFLGAQRDHLSEMVLLSTHNICFSHQYQACV